MQLKLLIFPLIILAIGTQGCSSTNNRTYSYNKHYNGGGSLPSRAKTGDYSYASYASTAHKAPTKALGTVFSYEYTPEQKSLMDTGASRDVEYVSQNSYTTKPKVRIHRVSEPKVLRESSEHKIMFKKPIRTQRIQPPHDFNVFKKKNIN